MPRGTLDPGCSEQISCTGLSPCLAGLPRPFHYPFFHVMPVQTPKILRPSVWPLPRSLATTSGISVDFFSSPYLDVSVQAVPRVRLFDSTHADGVLLRRVSPFGNLRINSYLRLPEAYRSLSRPSPKLIAACHVLHRLLMPRHSPCALYSLTYFLVNKKVGKENFKLFLPFGRV